MRLEDDGTAVVEAGTHDIGTGAQTVLIQIAADTLGIDPSRVSILWGDTRLPKAGPVYGSSATMTTGGSVMLAAKQAKEKLTKLAPKAKDHGAAMRQLGISDLVGDGRISFPGTIDADGADIPHALRTWGAVFLELGVDPELGLLRLRRVVVRTRPAASSIQRRPAVR